MVSCRNLRSKKQNKTSLVDTWTEQGNFQKLFGKFNTFNLDELKAFALNHSKDFQKHFGITRSGRRGRPYRRIGRK